MGKSIFLIDGFNLYHSIVDTRNPVRFNAYKWLDLDSLSRKFIQSQDVLSGIYYFTAKCIWNNAKDARHSSYIQALENKGVKIVLGKFKEITKKCRAICQQNYRTFEEKRTDVNIAIHLLSLAQQDKFDIAYLITADSDLIPAIEEVKKNYPQKKVVVIIPFGKSADEIKSACHSNMKIKEIHLSTSQFPDNITLNNGIVVSRPATWS